MYKQYITPYHASLYSKVYIETIKKYMREGILTPVTRNKLIDPDELEALMKFREKFGKISNSGAYVGWVQGWLSLKEEITDRLKVIPTFIDTERQNVEYKTYTHRLKDVNVLACLLDAPFRVISKDFTKRIKENSYLIKDENKLYATPQVEFELEYVENHFNIRSRQDIIEYILSHPDFKDELLYLLINDELTEIDIVDQMIKGDE